MKDEDKTKEQLIAELVELRRRNSDPSSFSRWFFTGRPEVFVSNRRNPDQRAGDKNIKYKFADLVDIPFLQKLLTSFYESTGIPHGLHDEDHNILSGIGWQDICAKFHRVCPGTECRCKQSDSYIADHLHDGPYVGYKCMNGLMDFGTPIVVEGQHLASIFLGQFLLEPPDEEYFRRQAQEYGFDEAAYMEALRRVPIIPEEQVNSIMRFYTQLGQFLATMGLERKRQLEAADQAIRLSEECFYKAFNVNPIIMIISTLDDGRIVKVNDAFCSITGYTPDNVIGKKTNDIRLFVNPADYFLMKQKLMTNQPVKNMEFGFYKHTGEPGQGLYSAELFDNYGEPCILSVMLDITELKQMEAEMARLDQLNLVGKMAASIGHEIRNPMTSVRGFLQMFKTRYIEDEDLLNLMIEELDRANLIISEFLSLAKNKVVELKPENLNEIIGKLLPLIQAQAQRRDQDVKLEQDKLPDLMLDKKEIHQLILNMVNNGLEAMASPGAVIIKTYLEEEQVVLAIKDEGHGIDRNLLNKLGTPFFTTKEQGTGLGLAVCYRIANRHNAKIDIETSSTGTTFYVRFPNPISLAAVL